MQAIIKTGGKQYKVSEEQYIRIESVEGEVGEKINFDKVLFISEDDEVHFGSPLIKGASVEAQIQFHGRADKVKIVKFKRRKHHMRTTGHRQNFSQVKITKISLQDTKSASKKVATKSTAKKVATKTTKPVEKKTATKSVAKTTAKKTDSK